MIIILVNGTFAPKAAWTKEPSQIVKVLRAEFGADLQLTRFRWSGFNSHRRRIRAGEKLARYIRRLKTERPGKRIFVIAHSHGGNVLGYAIRALETHDYVDGAVFMATPFIQVEPRELGGTSWLLGLTVPLLMAPVFCLFYLAAVVFAGSFYFEERLMKWAETQNIVVQIAWFLIPVAFILIVLTVGQGFIMKKARFIGGPLRERVVSRFQDYQSRKSKELEWTEDAGTASLIVRIEGDEAGFGLRCIYLISEILPRLWKLALVATLFLVALVAISYAATFLGEDWLETCANIASYLPFSGFLRDKPETMMLWSISAFFLWILVLLGFQLIMAVIPMIIRAHRFGFGGESILDNWLLTIRAVSQPSSMTTAAFCELSLDTLAKQLWWRFRYKLRHSVYENEEALAAIVKWLRSHQE